MSIDLDERGKQKHRKDVKNKQIFKLPKISLQVALAQASEWSSHLGKALRTDSVHSSENWTEAMCVAQVCHHSTQKATTGGLSGVRVSLSDRGHHASQRCVWPYLKRRGGGRRKAFTEMRKASPERGPLRCISILKYGFALLFHVYYSPLVLKNVFF